MVSLFVQRLNICVRDCSKKHDHPDGVVDIVDQQRIAHRRIADPKRSLDSTMFAVPPSMRGAPQVFHPSGGKPFFIRTNMTTNPTMIVNVAQKNPSSILGPSLSIFLMSQRSNIIKIIAGMRLPTTHK